MRPIIYFPLFLMAITCHLACGQTTEKSNSDSAAIAKSNTKGDADSVESYEVNASGDRVPYFHWAADDEILGLANTAFGDLDSIVARGYIRVLVPYSKTYYYVEGMKRYGLAFELVNLFEAELNKQLKFNPPQNSCHIHTRQPQTYPEFINGGTRRHDRLRVYYNARPGEAGRLFIAHDDRYKGYCSRRTGSAGHYLYCGSRGPACICT